MSLAAYKKTIRETESPRQMERRVLAQVTARLDAHQEDFDIADDRGTRLTLLAEFLRPILHDNVTLWMTFQADLLQPQNSLPAELRASLISLSMFIERHTARVLAGEAKVSVLVDVNRSILQALEGQAEAAAV
ncbi:flagellar biosynthesis regulator FlaF [Sulfitobacter aestuarii]|uniref:Flagellar biosynthesis regulator FlaF n=1 Tax=Sulfitobacter aestuarii TaxID=2161676 RepID=A0ABW5U1S8_9RHOB